MSWVSIDYDKCNSCGICLEICVNCFSREDDSISVNADERLCNICGHCVALCPAGAISHDQMDMGNFNAVKKDKFVPPEDFFEFLRQRRSHRHFKKQRIEKRDMEKLVEVVRYSPTGSNRQSVELLVIQDPARIKLLSNLSVDFLADNGARMVKDLEKMKAEGKGTFEEISMMEMIAMYGEMLKKARDMGRDPIFYGASAVVVFHSKCGIILPKDDCVIASTTMGLLARTMGLEFTYIGLFENAANNHPSIKEELNLPDDNQVFSVIIIGYPKFRFLRTVDRKPVVVKWG